MNPNSPMGIDAAARDFYRDTMRVLEEHQIPFMVGGAYALQKYTGVARDTKDFDIFMLKQDVKRALHVLASAGYKTELTDKIWLAKVFHADRYVDVIFGSANGIAGVDAAWFEFSVPSEVLDLPVLLVPPEEMIWQKAYIMERDRYDGADIAHIIHTCGDALNWHHLLGRFDGHWRVLLAQLVLYGFIYPADRHKIPQWLMLDLMARLNEELESVPPAEQSCQGTLFSLTQYVVDIHHWGYSDVRSNESGGTAA